MIPTDEFQPIRSHLHAHRAHATLTPATHKAIPARFDLTLRFRPLKPLSTASYPTGYHHPPRHHSTQLHTHNYIQTNPHNIGIIPGGTYILAFSQRVASFKALPGRLELTVFQKIMPQHCAHCAERSEKSFDLY
jgi:hypothetical protein